MADVKEIGGYFEMEHLCGAEYHRNLLRLNLGRTALVYACQALLVDRLYLPRFLCDSVTGACENARIPVSWYSIGRDFLPEEASLSTHGNAWVYIVNYYGQITNSQIAALKEKYGNIIVDNTHSFFQHPVPGVPTLYSCRKYFGLPDGAYLSLPDQADTSGFSSLPEDVSGERMSHILGRYEHSASDYYSFMLSTAHAFCEEPVKRMSPLTRNLLKGIDYEGAAAKRSRNYEALQTLLCEKNGMSFSMPEKGPFVYPFYTKAASVLKKKLAEKKIFIPTYWSNVTAQMPESSLEWDLAAHILPLPVDQRYDTEAMTYMAETILQLLQSTAPEDIWKKDF